MGAFFVLQKSDTPLFLHFNVFDFFYEFFVIRKNMGRANNVRPFCSPQTTCLDRRPIKRIPNVNKIFIIKTLGKISAVWYNRRYINEFGKAGLINESCCYGYR